MILPDAIRTSLAKGAKIDVETARAAMDDTGRLMIALLPCAAEYARVPISGFHVGAVALGTSGTLYLGANMEFPGHALSFSVHGEQSAITHAWLCGETGLEAIAVNAAPCGYCRQFMWEIAGSSGLSVLLRKDPGSDSLDYTDHKLTHYLPNAFGPRDLEISDLLMRPQDHRLKVDADDALVLAALGAANASYSPYSGDFAGVALQLDDGSIHAGRYAENAAYSPSMSPLQSALAMMNMSRRAQAPYRIAAAVLVETRGVKVSQRSATEAVLSSVAPGISLRCLEAVPET